MGRPDSWWIDTALVIDERDVPDGARADSLVVAHVVVVAEAQGHVPVRLLLLAAP
jgi:hypothetical protein